MKKINQYIEKGLINFLPPPYMLKYIVPMEECMIGLQEAKDPKLAYSRLEGVRSAIKNRSLLTLVVEPISLCNLACTFCDLHSGRIEDVDRYKGQMSSGTFARIVDQLTLSGIVLKEMQFHGNGEPLLHKKFSNFVGYAREQKVAERYRLTTNGTGLSKKNLKSVIDAGITDIHVSLDVANREKYALLKGKDLYKLVEKNILTAIDVVQNSSCRLFIKYAIPHADDKYGFSSAEARGVFEKFEFVAENSKNVHLKGMPVVTLLDGVEEMATKFSTPCEIPFFSLFIRFDGTVTVCCADITGQRLFLGNINDTNLDDILNSQKLRDVRLSHLDGDFEKYQICLYCGNRGAADVTQIADELREFL